MSRENDINYQQLKMIMFRFDNETIQNWHSSPKKVLERLKIKIPFKSEVKWRREVFILQNCHVLFRTTKKMFDFKVIKILRDTFF